MGIMGVLARAEQNSVGMPVAVMNDDYSNETLALSEEIELYANMDLYSSDRPKIVQVRAYGLLLARQAMQELKVPRARSGVDTQLSGYHYTYCKVFKTLAHVRPFKPRW